MQTFIIATLGTYVFTWVVLSCFRGVTKKNAIAIWTSLIISMMACAIVDGIHAANADLRTDVAFVEPIEKQPKEQHIVIENGDTSTVNVYYPELTYDEEEDCIRFHTSEDKYAYSHEGYKLKIYVTGEQARMYFVCLDARPDIPRDNPWVTSWVRPSVTRSRVLVMPRHWINTMSEHRQKHMKEDYDFYKLSSEERDVVSKAVEQYETKHYEKETDNIAWCPTEEDK